MEFTKIARLTDAERETLLEAGKLLKAIYGSATEKEFDKFEDTDLIIALNEVADKCAAEVSKLSK